MKDRAAAGADRGGLHLKSECPPWYHPVGTTILALVDALTRVSGKLANAGDHSEADAKASGLRAGIAHDFSAVNVLSRNDERMTPELLTYCQHNR